MVLPDAAETEKVSEEQATGSEMPVSWTLGALVVVAVPPRLISVAMDKVAEASTAGIALSPTTTVAKLLVPLSGTVTVGAHPAEWYAVEDEAPYCGAWIPMLGGLASTPSGPIAPPRPHGGTTTAMNETEVFILSS